MDWSRSRPTRIKKKKRLIIIIISRNDGVQFNKRLLPRCSFNPLSSIDFSSIYDNILPRWVLSKEREREGEVWSRWAPDVGYADDETRGIPRAMHANGFSEARRGCSLAGERRARDGDGRRTNRRSYREHTLAGKRRRAKSCKASRIGIGTSTKMYIISKMFNRTNSL